MVKCKSNKITESDVDDLTPREGDRVLLYVMSDKGKKRCKWYEGDRVSIARLGQVWSRDRILKAINEPKLLDQKLSVSQAMGDKLPSYDHLTPPMEMSELIPTGLVERLGQAGPNMGKRRDVVREIVLNHMIRMYEEDENLMNKLKAIRGYQVEYLVPLASNSKGMLHKRNMYNGINQAARWSPLEIPDVNITPNESEPASQETKVDDNPLKQYESEFDDEEADALIQQMGE